MITISRIETVYPAPDYDEDDYCPEGESTSQNETVSFRELVDLMREHPMPSSSPLQGTQWDWLSSEPYQDPYTGAYVEYSIHFAPKNPARNLKYWRAAMIAAGHKVRP